MKEHAERDLSRRERQIMDIVYARGKASATEVMRELPDAPTKPAVRRMLTILEDRGHLRHAKKGREFIYAPVRPRLQAGRSALRRVLATFFDGSLEKAVTFHLSDPKSDLSDQELRQLADLIRGARKKEK